MKIDIFNNLSFVHREIAKVVKNVDAIEIKQIVKTLSGEKRDELALVYL